MCTYVYILFIQKYSSYTNCSVFFKFNNISQTLFYIGDFFFASTFSNLISYQLLWHFEPAPPVCHFSLFPLFLSPRVSCYSVLNKRNGMYTDVYYYFYYLWFRVGPVILLKSQCVDSFLSVIYVGGNLYAVQSKKQWFKSKKNIKNKNNSSYHWTIVHYIPRVYVLNMHY